MSQALFDSISPPTTSGTQFASIVTAFKDAVVSGFSGSSRPSQIQPGGFWVDTSGDSSGVWNFKIFDGTQDIVIFTINKNTGLASIPSSESLFEIQKISADSVGPVARMVKKRLLNGGQTISGDVLGEVQFNGMREDGQSALQARVRSVSQNNVTSTQQGAYLSFEITTLNGSSLSEVLRLVDGKVAIGGVTSPEETLHVKGTGVKVEKVGDDTTASKVVLRKKRTANSGQILSGDTVASISANSTDNAGSEVEGARVEFVAVENHTATAQGTKVSFKNKSVGQNTLSEKLAIEDIVKVKTHLTVEGNLTVSGSSNLAPLASPQFTGTPTAPTPTLGDDSTKLATTAFVKNSLSGVSGSSSLPQLNNKIINGNFDYLQRYPLSTVAYSQSYNSFYFFDRWVIHPQGDWSDILVEKSSGPSGLNSSSLRISVDSQGPFTQILGSDGYYNSISQAIEGIVFKDLIGKSLVLSFWVNSSKVGVYSVNFSNADASRIIVKTFTINTANTWEKKIIRLDHSTVGTWNVASGVGLRINFILDSSRPVVSPDSWITRPTNDIFNGIGTSATGQVFFSGGLNSFNLTDVVLVEDNSTKTLEPKFTYAGSNTIEELTLCRRYFEKSFDLSTYPQHGIDASKIIHKVGINAVGGMAATFNFQEEKRASPSLSFYNPSGTGNFRADSTNLSVTNFTRVASPSSFTLTNTVAIGTPTLAFHYAADAELF